MSARFIVRVDDVGQRWENQQKVDHGLREFFQWWDAGGWGEEPIYLGVVPAGLDIDYELGMLKELEVITKAELCIHGWDHARQRLTPAHIGRARAALPNARCVTPPFNLYDGATVDAMAILGDEPVLFGGLLEVPGVRAADHAYGPRPLLLGNVLHLAAEPALYKRAHELVDVVRDYPDPGYPLVITLHTRWDLNPEHPLEAVGALRKALAGRMASVDEARAYAANPPKVERRP